MEHFGATECFKEYNKGSEKQEARIVLKADALHPASGGGATSGSSGKAGTP